MNNMRRDNSGEREHNIFTCEKAAKQGKQKQLLEMRTSHLSACKSQRQNEKKKRMNYLTKKKEFEAKKTEEIQP